MKTLSVRLLGSAQVAVGRGAVHFTDDKRYQLLTHLAYKTTWVSREQLAYLFWPETNTQAARKNLRHLLQRTRGLEWLAGLEAEDERLRWNVHSDVQDFLKALAEAAWERAIGLYQGTLLEGFTSEDSLEFSAWLETEREQLKNHWHGAVLGHVKNLEAAGKHLEASSFLAKLLEQDEFDEETLKAYMLATLRAGQRGQALKAYGAFRQRLSEELDLRPSAALEQLAQAIRSQDPALLVAVAPSPEPQLVIETEKRKTRPLPMPATPFVGRDLLLGEITNTLLHSDCRLLTLTGPGGVGKTRLALQVAQELQERFRDGVCFVSLVALSSATSFANAISEMLDFSFQGQVEPLEQLTRHIGEQHMLLVLDNFEHLLKAAPQVVRLLQGCPRVRLLVTSRERLGLVAEQVLPIEGLLIPTDPAQALQSDVVQLFALRAQRLRPQFRLDSGNLPAVLEICRLVEGFPLGIELAAVWARALPLGAIVSEISQNMDFLESRSSDLAERHQSIRAAFEHSWHLLTPEEQRALCRLSVFRGGFRREAAKQAAGVSLPVLTSLLDKSLIYANAEGRYFRHALLYQYMQEKLAENATLEREAQTEHGLYYLRFLQRCLEDIRGANPQETFAHMEEEFENLRSAWHWAASEGKSYLIKSTTEALMRFLDAQACYQDGIELFGAALARLGETESEDQAAKGTLLVHQGKFYERQGRHDQAEHLTFEALSLLRPLGEREPMIWGLGTLGAVAADRGHYDKALAYKEEALEEAKVTGNDRLIALCFGWLAIAEHDLGYYPKAQHYYREAIDLFNKLGNRIGAIYNLNDLAALTLELGQLDEARTLLLETLAQARASGITALVPEIMRGLSHCHFKLGLYHEAASYGQQALVLLKDHNHRAIETEMLTILGQIAVARADYSEAKSHLTRALHMAWSIQAFPLILRTLAHWAEYLLAVGKTPSALILLRLVSHHAATNVVYREQALRLLSNHQAVGDSLEVLSLAEAVQQILYG